MQERQFSTNIVGPVVLFCIWLIVGWLIQQVSRDLILTMLNGGHISNTWLIIIFLDVAFLSSAMVSTWAWLKNKFIFFNENSIKRLYFYPVGYKNILWQNIVEIRLSNFYLYIRSPRESFKIPLLIYKNPDELVDYVKNQYKKAKAQE